MKKVVCALRTVLFALLGAQLVALSQPLTNAQAVSPAPTHGAVVPDTPQRNWPRIVDGTVDAGDQVGGYVVYGGSFKTLEMPDGSTLTQPSLVALNVDTGEVLSTFRPVIDGTVSVIEAGITPGTVYIGGSFKSVNGVPVKRIAKLSMTTGEVITAFNANSNGEVKTMSRVGTRLFVGGGFTAIKGEPRANLAELNTTNGTPSGYFTVGVTGLRNTGCNIVNKCRTLKGVVVRSVRATPDGRTLMVAHRGDKVGGLTRWGMAKIDISATRAVVTGWRTDLWDLARNNGRTDYVGIVEGDISPDGSYFAITNIIGNYPPLHDTVIAFPVAGSSLVQPLWVTQNFDSNYAVAVSDQAVYVGGHFCWTESATAPVGPLAWPGASGNQYSCNGTSGSVFQPDTTYRYHIEALDPATGRALPWNPESNSFNGVNFLRSVPRGLMLGHDGTRVKGVNVGRSTLFDLLDP
jgi:trimeric autotransporter adhesin